LVSPELDNPYFDENYVELLKKLSKCCSNIETLEKLGKYEECKNKINVDLKNDILEIFPDLKERFTQEYDEHDFEEN
jgi:hypothetical protein